MQRRRPAGPDDLPAYAELHCLSNFSFLCGASHPEELVDQAAFLGYRALAITDRNSLAGIVRAHIAAKEHHLHLIIGAEITPLDGPPIVLLTPDRGAYAKLCRLITRGRLRARKGECELYVADVAEFAAGMIGVVTGEGGLDPLNLRSLDSYLSALGDDLYLALSLDAHTPDAQRLAYFAELSAATGIPLVATNHVHYHLPERRYLQDVLTCIREKCTVAEAGYRLFCNAERHLRPREEIARRYGAALAGAVAQTVEIAERCRFTLDELRYDYPHELCPAGKTRIAYLAELTWRGAAQLGAEGSGTGSMEGTAAVCAPVACHTQAQGSALRAALQAPSAISLSDQGLECPAHLRALIPDDLHARLAAELKLIAELRYEAFFLTVWDLVRFARGRGILCQGRGSAANSAVCFCLGVTAVDPQRIDLLFERFISRERNEPPDIDIDFEHERREEVFQYIYQKYGRDRAGITAEVITYRPRSAVRDVGKALGFSLDQVDKLAKSVDWWIAKALPEDELRMAGLNPADRNVQMLVRLVHQVLGFPRHLSQHVGGFVLTDTPLCEIVPLENGAMPDRTFIEWDKDDIDAMGILKVDCLALGMLTAISKAFGLLVQQGSRSGAGSGADCPDSCLWLRAIPPEDPAVYEMLSNADSVGVFQVESRAQMTMLPRLKPKNFYDLVIEVSIVRPGPIQGGMVHPYLKRRDGLELVTYPSEAIKGVLAKTLGVPLFQEQVMRLAVVAAGFTPGEADQLRRAMGAWRRSGSMDSLREKLFHGLYANGYSQEFAQQIFEQIRGFGEYGFPESHAASFALLVYASAWLKRYHPAAFCGALINSQPMGFYAPAQLIRDARAHGVEVRGIDVNFSGYDCLLEKGNREQKIENRGYWPDFRESADGSLPDGRGSDQERRVPNKECNDSLSFPVSGSLIPDPSCWGVHGPALRLGMRLVRGLSEAKVAGILEERRRGPIRSIAQLARRKDVSRETLLRLAAANSFGSLGLNRRQALWRILACDDADLPLFAELEVMEQPARLPEMELSESIQQDYKMAGLSLEAHPLQLIRTELQNMRAVTSADLNTIANKRRVRVAGIVTHRQRPGTAGGIVFMTLEDECGVANLVVRPNVWERDRVAARASNVLLVDGQLQKEGKVIHVVASRIQSIQSLLGGLTLSSRDFH